MPTEIPAPTPRLRLQRLPGRSPTLRLSRATPGARLWIGEGELVQEILRSYTQEVQRFAFGDIQALQIRRTGRGIVYNIVLAALLVLPLVGLASMDAGPAGFGRRLALAITAGTIALLVLINAVRGATCRAVLITALGPQVLPSLSRMRPARRALDAIINAVGTVQGALRPEEAARLVDQAQVPPRPAAAPLPVAQP